METKIDPYTEIVSRSIDKVLSQTKKPLLLAITGDSGSGKSHFSKLFQLQLSDRQIPFSYINHDDFLIPRKDREPMKSRFYTEGEFNGKSHWELLENMFYLDKFQKVIDDLRAGNPTTYFPYLREIGDISREAKTVPPADYVIFDTSMLLDKMDFVIVIDVTRENIIKRKLIRDSDIRTPAQIIHMHQKVQGYYWDRKKPTNPDIIIDNNDFNAPNIVKI